MDKVRSVQELIERTAHMPLERMRFFINEDRREPRCFGIYHDDAEDRWVVYKNKSDGSRAVRYSGPDEAYAANELWMKLQSEIDLRRPKQANPKAVKRYAVLVVASAIIIIAMVVTFLFFQWRAPRRGYYRVGDELYYYQNPAWYCYDDGWNYYDAPDGDWYAEGDYERSYPYDNSQDAFEHSDYYVEPDDHDRDDSGVFDSWDSGGTDWDSDW